MAIFTDQTIAGNFDPGFPPSLPGEISVTTITINDADDDGFIRSDGGDQLGDDVGMAQDQPYARLHNAVRAHRD